MPKDKSKFKVVTTPLEVITVKEVMQRSVDCPFDRGLSSTFRFSRCNGVPRCMFYLGEEKCGWREYTTKTFNERCDTDHDPYGAMTPNDYYKSIRCAFCETEIVFYSSYSSLAQGDKKKCPKCETPHVFLRTNRVGEGEWNETFAIPQMKSKEVS